MALMPLKSPALSANSPRRKLGESLGRLGNVAPHCLASLGWPLWIGSGSSYIALGYQFITTQ